MKKVCEVTTNMDDFGKTTIRISPRQAEILLELVNKHTEVSDLTAEDVYALNSIHYSLQAVKETEQGDIA